MLYLCNENNAILARLSEAYLVARGAGSPSEEVECPIFVLLVVPSWAPDRGFHPAFRRLSSPDRSILTSEAMSSVSDISPANSGRESWTMYELSLFT